MFVTGSDQTALRASRATETRPRTGPGFPTLHLLPIFILYSAMTDCVILIIFFQLSTSAPPPNARDLVTPDYPSLLASELSVLWYLRPMDTNFGFRKTSLID